MHAWTRLIHGNVVFTFSLDFGARVSFSKIDSRECRIYLLVINFGARARLNKIDSRECRIYLLIKFWCTCTLEQEWFKGMSYLPSHSVLRFVHAWTRLIHGNVVFTFLLDFGARASFSKIDSREGPIYLLVKFWCTCKLEQDWFKGMSYLPSH